MNFPLHGYEILAGIGMIHVTIATFWYALQ